MAEKILFLQISLINSQEKSHVILEFLVVINISEGFNFKVKTIY